MFCFLFKMGALENAILMAICLNFLIKLVASHPAQEPLTLTEAQDDQLEELEKTGNNPFSSRKILDSKGRYILEWLVDHDSKIITFNIKCRTTGWVGLGFSKDGQMGKADLVIAGVNSSEEASGMAYIMDLHSDYSRKVKSDTKQDWTLVSSAEKNGFTILQITRPFDTCDPQDYPITMDLLWVIWAFGETDNIVKYHFHNRGRFRVYLLDPNFQTQKNELERWELRNKVILTGKKTTYVCTIHRAPILTEKHSIVEFHAYLENEIAVQHTHHIVLYRCVIPPGFTDFIFELWTSHPGEECYFGRAHVTPMMLCKLVIHAWAIGGEPFILPKDFGFPLGEFPFEYYMLEMHYNNPLGYSGVTFTSGLDIYYTDKPRKKDAGELFVFYDPLGLFMVPPISTNFEVYGYCTPDCTKSMIPESGVEIIGVVLHAHISGKKVRLQHIRNGKNLPIILKDDNYDSTYQQNRILIEPRLLLPDDELIVSCEHDNTWTNITTLSGFATFEEMCMAGLLLSERIPYFLCASQIPQEKLLPIIGVEHVEWDMDKEMRKVTLPEHLADKPLQYVADKLTNWDEALRNRIQKVTSKGNQIGMCPQVLAPSKFKSFEDMIGIIIDPVVKREDFLTMAKGYGTQVLLGSIQLPTRTPGPISVPIQEGVEYRVPGRTCPKIPSPFSTTTSAGNSFDGRAVGRTAMGYLHYRQPFAQYANRKF